jgi:tight adherence protein C
MTIALTLVAVFACVAILTGSVTTLAMQGAEPGRRRIKDLLRPTERAQADAGLLANAPDPVLKRFSTFVPKSPKEMSRIQKRLALGGFHETKHAVVYVLAEIVLTAIGFVAPAYLFGWGAGLIFAFMGAIVGYLAPSMFIDRKIKLRQKEIENGLPDALDLLIVSIEAGLAIDQAVVKCAEELTIAYPALAEELRFVNVECRAGKPRLEAFKNFASRTKVDDVRALVAMLVQTDRFGTSVAQALRTHAEVSRTKRRQRAEERAAKIGVKLVFPLVFCLFPAFYVVTLGSAVIKFVHAFSLGGPIGGFK